MFQVKIKSIYNFLDNHKIWISHLIGSQLLYEVALLPSTNIFVLLLSLLLDRLLSLMMSEVIDYRDASRGLIGS